MVGKYLARSALAIMALLAAGVALYSFRFYGVLADSWLDVDPGIRAVIARVPIQALTHMLIGPIALFLGPFQFSSRLRAKYPQAHRWSGRVYVTACVAAGIAALAASPYASGGPVAGLGFGIFGGALGLHRDRRMARRRATPVCAASLVDAVQLRDDVCRGDLAAADSPRVCAWIPELLGDVGMARLHLLDSER